MSEFGSTNKSGEVAEIIFMDAWKITNQYIAQTAFQESVEVPHIKRKPTLQLVDESYDLNDGWIEDYQP